MLGVLRWSQIHGVRWLHQERAARQPLKDILSQLVRQKQANKAHMVAVDYIQRGWVQPEVFPRVLAFLGENVSMKSALSAMVAGQLCFSHRLDEKAYVVYFRICEQHKAVKEAMEMFEYLFGLESRIHPTRPLLEAALSTFSHLQQLDSVEATLCLLLLTKEGITLSDYSMACAAYAREGSLKGVEDIIQRIVQAELPVTDEIRIYVVMAFAKCKEVERAEVAFTALEQPKSTDFAVLIEMYADQENVDKVLEFLKTMSEADIPPTVSTLKAALTLLQKKELWTKAVEIAGLVQRCGIQPDRELAVLLMALYTERGRAAELNTMIELSKPFFRDEDAGVVNVVIENLVTIGAVGKAEEVLQLTESSLNPNSFHTVMRHHAKCGDTASCLSLLENMQKMNVIPTSLSYKLMFTACAHAKQPPPPELSTSAIWKHLNEQTRVRIDVEIINEAMAGYKRERQLKDLLELIDLVQVIGEDDEERATFYRHAVDLSGMSKNALDMLRVLKFLENRGKCNDSLLLRAVRTFLERGGDRDVAVRFLKSRGLDPGATDEIEPKEEFTSTTTVISQ